MGPSRYRITRHQMRLSRHAWSIYENDLLQTMDRKSYRAQTIEEEIFFSIMNNLKYTTYLVRISFQQKNHRDHSFIHKPKLLGISAQASMWACRWPEPQIEQKNKKHL